MHQILVDAIRRGRSGIGARRRRAGNDDIMWRSDRACIRTSIIRSIITLKIRLNFDSGFKLIVNTNVSPRVKLNPGVKYNVGIWYLGDGEPPQNLPAFLLF